ncbi:MAG: DUF4326 domain-containing protein [Methanosarcinaceae archaeon]|nr:DUF4326 domain-containing protein [Methanosarcinaceae archaeon]
MKVINMKNEMCNVKVDRSSVLGNPFKIGKDGNREEVIAKYRSYLNNCILVCDELNRLKDMPDDTVLGCWCKPKSCHGDVVINAVKYLKSRKEIK